MVRVCAHARAHSILALCRFRKAVRKGSRVTGSELLRMNPQPPQLPRLDQEIQVATSFGTSVLPFVLEVTESPLIPFLEIVLWGRYSLCLLTPAPERRALSWDGHCSGGCWGLSPRRPHPHPGHIGVWGPVEPVSEPGTPKSCLEGRRVQRFGASFLNLNLTC